MAKPGAGSWVGLSETAGGNEVVVTSGAVTVTGVATEATLAAIQTLIDGLATAAETQPVSLASVPSHAVTGPVTDAQLRASPVPVSGTVSVTEPVTVDGTVALDAGSLAALETTELGATTLAALETIDLGATTLAALETIGLDAATLAALETIGLDAATLAALETISVTGTVTTKETRAGTAATSLVADSASSVTVLALNANRLGASITNDSSARLYLKLGTTASLTDYTVSLAQHDHYETAFGYTGRIDGIWATDPGDGAARVTELTA